MRALIWVLRIVGGLWFWLYVIVALTSLFMSTNVATGRVSWSERLGLAAAGFAFAVPGLVAWILASRWLKQPRPEPRGFSILPADDKAESTDASRPTHGQAQSPR